jgi:hypothetical protein
LPDRFDVVSFDRSSPVLAYWLPRCEGFRVRAGGRRGVVREVQLSPTGEAARLVVAFGLGRKTVVAARDVHAVVPAEEVLVVGSPPPRPQRAAKQQAAAGPRRPSRVATGARTTARATARAAGRLGRSVGVAAAVSARSARRASAVGARAGWEETVRAWRAGGRRRAAANGWLETRALAYGRRASLLVDDASRRAVSWLVAGIGRVRAAAIAAARALRSRASSQRSSGDQTDADARERPA